MFWLTLGTKTTRLAFGKDHYLLLSPQKLAGSCPDGPFETSSGFKLRNVDTPSRATVSLSWQPSPLAVTPPPSAHVM